MGRRRNVGDREEVGLRMKMLIMGLSGSGKTTLANALKERTLCKHLNADEIREKYNDWDFSNEGRIRQAVRMNILSNRYEDEYPLVICDFIAPLAAQRKIVRPDIVVWCNTVEYSRFKDTDAVFENPDHVDLEIKTKDTDFWLPQVIALTRNYKCGTTRAD